MRILFLTNFYPPAHLGGMELRCQEVVSRLQAKGHTCEILTSTFATTDGDVPEQARIRRILTLESDVYHYRPFDHLMNYKQRLHANVRVVRSSLDRFRPDIVFIWGMWNMSPAIAAEVERLGPGMVVYSFADYWPIEPDVHERFWLGQTGEVPTQLLLRLGKPLALSHLYRPVTARSLRFDHAIACSQFVLDRLRAGGLALHHARVVYSGIDVEQFTPATGTDGSKVRILHAGGFARHKGAETAIRAVEMLIQDGQRDVELVIMGYGHPDFRAHLEALVAQAGLQGWIKFFDAVPRDQMPKVYRQFQVLVLPTLTAEPLSRVVMEGMACGLAIAATNTGGTPEMITDGQDGLLVKPGNSAALARQLRRLVADPMLRNRLAISARRTVETRFRIERMIDEIQCFLETVSDAGASKPSQRPGVSEKH